MALAGCNRETQGPVAVGNVFRASIETPSRVAFSDEGAFSWQAGDAVAVSTNAGFKTFTLKEGAGASVASFDGDLAGVTSATVAVYPASIAKADATVTLPAEYAWTEGQTNAAMYCDAVDLTKVNNFKHLGGIIKVSFAEIPAEADAMVLKAEAKITGDFAIADGKIAAGVGTDEVKVTFTAGSNPAAFYIPVPTEYKFAVELQAAGVTIEKSVKATSKAIKIDRKALVLMDPVGGPVKITIATVEDFLAFAAEGDTYPEGSEAVLTADITLPETFVPDTVAVNFDGQGHTITYALTLPEQSTTAYNGGVFSLYTGTMKNLKVAGTMSTETLHVGGIAGACGPESVFDHCESSVNITFPAYGTATPHLGGIVGNAGIDSQFIGCVNKGKLEYNVAARDKGRSTQIGGIAAYCLSRALFKDCVNDGDLVYYAKGSSRLGGMVGYPDDPIDITFDGCVNNGHILVDVVNPASGYQYVGGLTGYYATNSTAVATAKVLYKDCVNNGKVEVIGISTAKGQARIGGIASYAGCTDAKMETAGFANGSQCYEFDGCVNNGEVITDGTVANNTAGGIVGFAESSAQVICKNCTNKGKVSVAGSGSAGGIQGAKGGLNTVYTDCVVDAASVIEALGAGKVGLLCGNAAAYTGTFTGTIGPATVGNNGTQTVMASDNYKDFLFGAALGEGANTDGVVFEGPAAPKTIKDFAKEFVKVIDIWNATVGEIKMHSSVDATPNAHYIPDETTITVGDKTYNTADMYETASRCYLLVRGYNGLDTENYGAGKIAALEGGAQAMSTTEVPATHDYTWGSAPYNELGTYDIATGEGTGNNGHLIKIVDGQAVHSQVDVTILDNQVMRALNYSHGKDISNMCTYPRDPITNYAGSFSAKRALITYAFFFKYMLDNNLDKADGIGADVAIRSELFGDEGPAAPELKTEIATAEDFLSFVDNAKLYAGSDGVKLTADIELPATFEPDTLWCSIDGQGHKVTYTLDIPKESTRSAGLFTNIQDGLTVKDLKVAGSLKSGKAASGGIGGKCASNVTFENCESAVNILGDASGVTYHLGGIAGEIATGAVFRNCHNTGNIVYSIAGLGAGNNTQEGGIVAQINGDCLIENCVNDGIVEFHAGEKAPRIAGICGYVNDATDISFINCINNAEVFAEWKRNSGYAYIGGITGYYGTPKADCKILYSDCVNNGKVYSYGNTNIRCRIGGIAGYAGMTDDNATSQGVSESGTNWKYTNCTNNGEISNTGTNSANHIGGIIGFAERAAKLIIEGCTQNSNISQAGAGRAGGMLGMRGGSQSIYKDIKVTKNVLLEVTGAGDAKLIIGDNDTQIVTEMTGKIEAATVSVNGTATEMTADNYRDFLLKNALGEGGSTEGVVFDGGQPSYPAPFEKIVEGAQLDPTTLPGDWNVRGTSATKNGIYVLGGTGSDPRLVVPVDKSWCWNGTVSNEYDNVLSIAMTGISGTSIQGNMEWKAGADGKFWDYLWILNPSDKPEYAPYANTDLSKFYDKIPKGQSAVSIDIMTFTATLSNGEAPKILTPGVYKICDGDGDSQKLTVPDGCFALKFHLGNMQVQASEWYSKDIDRFMFCPLEYIIIFEKEGGSEEPGEQGEAAPMELVTAGAALDIANLPGSWNVRGNNSSKNGIYVFGGSGSDPKLVCPYDKTWDWNDSIYRESDNGLSIAVTSMEGTTVTGTTNWWAGADGKFWDYVWTFSNAEKPEYEPYIGTDLSKFYNKIPKGKYAFTLDLATMTATLNNGEKPKILMPGTYKFCDGVAGQVLEIPDGCFAMKFHLGNMQVQASEWYSKDIDRFMFYPLEYILIFEKE